MSGEPEASLPYRPSSRVESDAVVAYVHRDVVVGELEVDFDALGVGVPHDVVERLLDDPVQPQFDG